MVSQVYKLGTKSLTLKLTLAYISSLFIGFFLRTEPSLSVHSAAFYMFRAQFTSNFCNYEFNTPAVSDWALRKWNRSDHRERVCTNAMISITQKKLWFRQRKTSEIKMIVQGLNQEDSFSSGNFHPLSCSTSCSQKPARDGSPSLNCPLHLETSLGHDLSSKLHKAGVLQMNTLWLLQKVIQPNILWKWIYACAGCRLTIDMVWGIS